MNTLASDAPHILVVDDDDRLRALLKRYLNEQGFAVGTAASSAEAANVMQWLRFDAMVLDVMMPGTDGITFARGLTNAPPILFLSARGETHMRIEGLEAGADDYLIKPFEPKELVLRLRTILRRKVTEKSEATAITFGDFSFDLDARQLSQKGEILPLTASEAALLKALAERKGETVSREELAGLAALGNTRSVDVQITRLRRKIEPEGERPLYIQTVRGEGYCLYDA